MELNKISQTPLQMVISRHEKRIGCPFIPTRKQFYEVVGINQKRFGMLLRGELPMYVFEAEALAEFFGVEATELYNRDNPEKKVKSPA